MKSSLKSAWIEKLKSDEFVQIQGRLHDGKNGRCCLGVLCEIAPGTELDGSGYTYDGTKTFATLPGDLGRAIEVSAKVEIKLIEMNDSTYTFDEIADWIEENL